MIVAVRLLVLALVGVLTAANTGSAETVASVAEQWGLLGTWRLDCSAPPSRADVDFTFAVRAGQLFHDRDWGDGSDSSPVLSASATNDGGFEVLVRFDSLKQTRQWAYIKGGDGRIRTVSNRNVDTDEYSIRDGHFTANGNTTAWQTHCR
jgi:hypothetical protein